MNLKLPTILAGTLILILTAGFYLQVTSLAAPVKAQSALETAQPLILPIAERIYTAEDYLGEGAWSPNGNYLAVALNKTVVIFNRQLLEVTVLEGHTEQVNTVDWNHDGTRLASAGDDKTIRIWNMESGEGFGTGETTLTSHTDRIVKLRYSPDDTMLASLAYDGDVSSSGEAGYAFHVTWIWDLASGQVNYKVSRIADSLALDWSPDSQYVINSGNDEGARVVYFWNTETGIADYLLADPTDMFVDVAMHPTGDYLAVKDFARYILILDLNTSETIPNFNIRRYQFNYFIRILEAYRGILSWNSTGEFIALGDKLGNLFIVHLETAQVVVSLPDIHQGDINSIEWNPQYDLIFTISNEDKAVRIWNFETLPDFSEKATATPVYFPKAQPTPISIKPIKPAPSTTAMP